jgi:hypothetical protein
MIETMVSLKVNGRMRKDEKGCLMLDKNFVRENLDFVRERLATRGGP